MTTKQMLLSALIIGATTNIALGMEKKPQCEVFKDGWKNTWDGEDLASAILNDKNENLDHIKILRKNSALGYLYAISFHQNTIGAFKKEYKKDYDSWWGMVGILENRRRNDSWADIKNILEHTTSNNILRCDNTIILNSTDPFDCIRLKNQYEELEKYPWLEEKNNTTK